VSLLRTGVFNGSGAGKSLEKIPGGCPHVPTTVGTNLGLPKILF